MGRDSIIIFFFAQTQDIFTRWTLRDLPELSNLPSALGKAVQSEVKSGSCSLGKLLPNRIVRTHRKLQIHRRLGHSRLATGYQSVTEKSPFFFQGEMGGCFLFRSIKGP